MDTSVLSRLDCDVFLFPAIFPTTVPPTCSQCLRRSLACRLMDVCVLSPGLRGGHTLLLLEWGGKTQSSDLSQHGTWRVLGKRVGAGSSDRIFQVLRTEDR